ncbi:MAG TPA: ThiF family adenylyltransferase [Chloroflexia bacterium]|nr:ThiF family adenylyltransferase [Chloroflexia bacterium]
MVVNSLAPKASYDTPLLPIVGTRLPTRRVAVCGLAAVAGAAERLADCRVVAWQLCDDTPVGATHPLARLDQRDGLGQRAAAAFARVLRARTSWEDRWDFQDGPALTAATYPEIQRLLTARRPDLLLGGGDAPTLQLLQQLARELDVPAVLVGLLAGADPRAAILVLLPGDAGHGRDLPDLLRFLGHPVLLDPAVALTSPEAWMDWHDANDSAAALARALLLQGSNFAPPDLTRILLGEQRTALLQGAPGWPWMMRYLDLATSGPQMDRDPRPAAAGRGPLAGGPLLVVGCGSLGSQAARALMAAGAVRELAFVDGGQVAAADLVREFYTDAQIGLNKADALARQMMRMAPTERIDPAWTAISFDTPWSGYARMSEAWYFLQVAHPAQPSAWFEAMLDTVRPAAAILTVGSADDVALARVLRQHGIPHVVGRCDADATYFEAVIVDGARGPCLECVQGTAFPAPAQEVGATVLEIGRAADLLARLVWQLSLSPRARTPWFIRLLADGRTVLIGGNGVVRVRPFQPARAAGAGAAYGIQVPGQVVASAPAAPGAQCPRCARAASPLRTG